MSDKIDELISGVIVREGGFVNHPSDRGGATKYGITIGALRDWRRAPVSREDVANLTEDEARKIYRSKYFSSTGFDNIPNPTLLEFMFDFAVHSGPAAATRALQRAIGAKDDGVMGPVSLAALAKVTNWGMLFYRVKCERYELLLRFTGADHAQADFAVGWSNRLDHFEEHVN